MCNYSDCKLPYLSVDGRPSFIDVKIAKLESMTETATATESWTVVDNLHLKILYGWMVVVLYFFCKYGTIRLFCPKLNLSVQVYTYPLFSVFSAFELGKYDIFCYMLKVFVLKMFIWCFYLCSIRIFEQVSFYCKIWMQ